jgi:hypothetical protein
MKVMVLILDFELELVEMMLQKNIQQQKGNMKR